MLNFNYRNATQYVYGPGEHRNIGTLLKPHAPGKVLLHYGGSSCIRSGLLATVQQVLQEAGIEFVELGGVKPNPSVTLVRTGIELCRREGVGLVLAVGGGSVIDSAKGIAVGVPNSCDVWELYSRKGSIPEHGPLPVATLQRYLDDFLARHPQAEIDYIHGDEVVKRLGIQDGNAGFILPAISKNDLFPTVIRDGALPRKAFSMGHAWDKRFYLESRKIK